MYEKVNPKHPDKIADRIAGAIVDYAYTLNEKPKIAVEVLIGHGVCHVIIETSEELNQTQIRSIVDRISPCKVYTEINVYKQDKHLACNQENKVKCGDNGIFKGTPLTNEQKTLSKIARTIYEKYDADGKYIIDNDKLIICQSNANTNEIKEQFKNASVNPIGEWTGGTDVDTGATNRKLGSDMGDAVTGGGLHGKDLSKADVSVNIYAFIKAQEENKTINLCCAIGDEMVDGRPYSEIVNIANDFIKTLGGFEKLAEWGLF